jgi:hypothetical protein
MLANLNYIHILVASLAYFFLGALWYSLLFQKTWMALVNVKMDPENKPSMGLMFGTTFVLNFITALATACVLYFVQPPNILVALKVGAMLGVGYIGTSTAMNNMYALRPVKLTLIDAAYHIVSICMVSLILTLWH